jgi:hypothetical protein
MPLDPNNPFSDLVPKGNPGVILGPPKDVPVPANYEPDPTHPGAVRPIKGGPADATAGQDVSASDLTGDAYLATLDKPTATLVKALAEGRKSFPSGAALKAPYWQQMLSHVGNFDPGFDEVNYTSRSSTRRDFTSGVAARNIRALNTAIGHLGHLEEQSPGTASHGLTPLNALENTALRLTGDPGPTNFDTTVSALAGELTAVYRGAGGAEADIKRYVDQLSPNASKDQKEGAIRNIAGLLKSRLDALNDQYRQGMGTTAQPLQMLDPQAQLVVQHLGAFDASGAPQGTPGGGASPPGVSEMTPQQQAKDKEFLATNPTPDQYASFLGGLLNRPIDVPAVAARLKAAKGGASYSGAVDEGRTLKARIAAEDKMGLGTDPATTLAMQGGTLNLSDEAAGVGNALSGIVAAPFTGKFDPVGDYRLGRDEERMRIADARQQLGYGGSAIEAVSALGSGQPTAALSAIGPQLPDAAARAAKAAGVGGLAAGALAGFGSGEGPSESVAGLGVGALTGYSLGRYGPAVVSKVAPALAKVVPSRFRAPKGMAPDLANAAQAEGVDLIRPMVDPASRAKFGALESDPTAQPIVRAGAENVRNQIEGRVGDLGQGGTPLDTEAAGNIIQQGARTFIQRSKGVANTLYNRARSLSGDARFVPEKAIQSVDDQIAALSANKETNAGEIGFLNGLKSDLSTPGGKTIEELRQLRQSLRGRINEQNLGATQAEARAAQALDATQLDAATNLPAGAASAYRRADTYYRERAVHIDDVLNRFLGGNVDKGQARLSGEQAFSRLKSMTSPGGDGRRLGALMRDLEPNERQDIAATIAQSLGRRSPDEPFSAALFISQTNKLSPSAKRTIFGPDGAASIQNLRKLSQALKDAGGDINFSRSTTVANRGAIGAAARRFIAGITGLGPAAVGYAGGGAEGGLVGLAVGATAAGVAVGRKVLSARAMVNPRVSRWLAESAQASTPAQAKEAVRKLSVIIAREPAISHELRPIYDFLENRLAQPLAADPKQSGGANDQQQ